MSNIEDIFVNKHSKQVKKVFFVKFEVRVYIRFQALVSLKSHVEKLFYYHQTDNKTSFKNMYDLFTIYILKAKKTEVEHRLRFFFCRVY